MFYVYEWFDTKTNEVIYVGKGSRNRVNSKQHNKKFKEYISTHTCKSRIVKWFVDEQKAFEYEFARIDEMKSKNQCVCNIYRGGFGGTHECWNDEKRKKHSEYNVMKVEKQRERMRINNPMKNKDVAAKANSRRFKKVVIDGRIYENSQIASEILKVHKFTIYKWCKRGYNTEGKECRYLEDEQKKVQIQKTCSKVVFIDDIKFDSVRKAAEYLNVWAETLIRNIKQNKPCKGHICRYGNQQPSREKSDNSITEGSTTNE